MAETATHYTVQAVEFKKDLPATAQRGPLKVWKLSLADPDGQIVECERNKKPGNEFSVGQTVFGYTEQTDFGLKLHEVIENGAPDPKASGGTPTATSSGGGGGGGNRYERQPDHPINADRARHAAAMGCAPDYYRLMAEVGVMKPPPQESVDDEGRPNRKTLMLEQLYNLMVWLESTYPPDPRG